MKLTLLKALIFFLCVFQMESFLFGMEANPLISNENKEQATIYPSNREIAAYIIIDENGTEEASIAIDQEMLEILLKQSKTIKHSLKNSVQHTNTTLKIHLQNCSYSDYFILRRHLILYEDFIKLGLNPKHFFHSDPIEELIWTFRIADYLEIDTFIEAISYAVRKGTIFKLSCDIATTLDFPKNLLARLTKDINKKFQNFQKRISLNFAVQSAQFNYDCSLLTDKQKLLFVWIENWLTSPENSLYYFRQYFGQHQKLVKSKKTDDTDIDVTTFFLNFSLPEFTKTAKKIEEILNLHLGYVPPYFKSIIEQAFNITLKNALPSFSRLTKTAQQSHKLTIQLSLLFMIANKVSSGLITTF